MSEELAIEKLYTALVLVISAALIITSVLAKNATWLQWCLLIPTGFMLINAIASLKQQKEVY